MSSDGTAEPSSPTKVVEGLSKELECVICNSVMIDPRILDCQHAMCLRCIFGIVKRDRGNGVTVVCPFHCEERTRTKSDVRSLKRNPMINNLCVSVRERAFRNRTHESCDWCDQPLWKDAETSAAADPAFCDRCGAVTCETCANDLRCDHHYLCGGKKAERSGVPVRVLPMLLSPDMCLDEVVKDFESRGAPGCPALDRKTFEQLELDRDTLQAPNMRYLIGTQVDVLVESEAGKSGVFTSTLLPRDAIGAGKDIERHMVCHSCVTPSDLSPEVTNLNEVTAACDVLSTRLATIRRCTAALARTLTKASVPAMRASLAVAQAADAVLSVVDTTTVKRLRRLILVAHLLNVPHVERLAERVTHAEDDTVKEAMSRSLTTQIKLALSLSSRVYSQLDSLIDELEACASESSDLVLRCVEEMRKQAVSDHQESDDASPEPVRPDDSSLTSDDAAALEGIGLLSHSVQRCSRDILDIDVRLASYLSAQMDSILGEVAMDQEQRLSLEDLSGKVRQAAGHVRIVAATWTTVAAAAAGIGCAPPDEAGQPPSIPDPLSPEQESVLSGVDELVESLCPQIFDFRRQHFEMMESSPEQTHANRQVLLDQLSSLILQALDLFLKEELMRSQAQASLFSRVRAFERAVEARSPELRAALEPESAATDGSIRTHMLDALGFGASIGAQRSAQLCAGVAAFAADALPPRRVGLEESTAINNAALSIVTEPGAVPKRITSVASNDAGSVLRGQVLTAAIARRPIEVNYSAPAFVLSDKLRDRASTHAKRAFLALHPSEKKVKTQVVSMNASGLVLVPIAFDSLRLVKRPPSIVARVTNPLRERLGVNVPPETRCPKHDHPPTPSDTSPPSGTPTTAAASPTSAAAVQTDPEPKDPLHWCRTGVGVWHVRYVVDSSSGTIVQEPLPMVPIYEAISRIHGLLERPLVFAGISSAMITAVVGWRASVWAARVGVHLVGA
eukprot:CAMPEP_0174858346 /NCGR_PEP_ID=MMETSP1114-20130205/42259_1 /TAXON_ID=312471 /ORGANISM="Neobodo designis, Strain CCAP 1951/1" /LENGTH=962 /DNA_ID=CAMNT_0016093243 /DNA_START=32 /DNA_END=2916 /DNA_ORIENTATION=+